MFKKVLTTGVLGLSALGIASANASESGPYASLQAGWASSPTNTNVQFSTFTPKDNDLFHTGAAFRVSGGYQFNPYFAAEVGVLQLANFSVYGKDDTSDARVKLNIKQRAIDVALKGMISPVADCQNIKLYGKVGVAYLMNDTKAIVDELPPTVPAPESRIRNFAPEVAVGVSYDATQNVLLDFSVTHIHPMFGQNRPGNTTYAAFGIGFKFA